MCNYDDALEGTSVFPSFQFTLLPSKAKEPNSVYYRPEKKVARIVCKNDHGPIHAILTLNVKVFSRNMVQAYLHYAVLCLPSLRRILHQFNTVEVAGILGI